MYQSFIKFAFSRKLELFENKNNSFELLEIVFYVILGSQKMQFVTKKTNDTNVLKYTLNIFFSASFAWIYLTSAMYNSSPV